MIMWMILYKTEYYTILRILHWKLFFTAAQNTYYLIIVLVRTRMVAIVLKHYNTKSRMDAHRTVYILWNVHWVSNWYCLSVGWWIQRQSWQSMFHLSQSLFPSRTLVAVPSSSIHAADWYACIPWIMLATQFRNLDLVGARGECRDFSLRQEQMKKKKKMMIKMICSRFLRDVWLNERSPDLGTAWQLSI